MVGLIWGMLPHESENGNITEPPIWDSNSVGESKVATTYGIPRVVGSSPTYPSILPSSQVVRHRTLTPAVRWFESNLGNQVAL